jgi:hypothetical protein
MHAMPLHPKDPLIELFNEFPLILCMLHCEIMEMLIEYLHCCANNAQLTPSMSLSFVQMMQARNIKFLIPD